MIIIIDEFFLDILEKKYYIFLSYWLLVRIYSKARKIMISVFLEDLKPSYLYVYIKEYIN